MQDLDLDPWVGKIPWRWAWEPTPVFLSGEFHGQRSLVGYTSIVSQRGRHNWRNLTHTSILANDFIQKMFYHLTIMKGINLPPPFSLKTVDCTQDASRMALILPVTWGNACEKLCSSVMHIAYSKPHTMNLKMECGFSDTLSLNERSWKQVAWSNDFYFTLAEFYFRELNFILGNWICHFKSTRCIYDTSVCHEKIGASIFFLNLLKYWLTLVSLSLEHIPRRIYNTFFW